MKVQKEMKVPFVVTMAFVAVAIFMALLAFVAVAIFVGCDAGTPPEPIGSDDGGPYIVAPPDAETDPVVDEAPAVVDEAPEPAEPVVDEAPAESVDEEPADDAPADEPEGTLKF